MNRNYTIEVTLTPPEHHKPRHRVCFQIDPHEMPQPVDICTGLDAELFAEAFGGVTLKQFEKVLKERREIASMIAAQLTDALVECFGAADKENGYVVLNVPRLGENAGYVHKETGSFDCLPTTDPIPNE